MLLKYVTLSMLLKYKQTIMTILDDKAYNRKILSRQRFFDTTIHIPNVIEAITGKNEWKIEKVISSLGYTLGKDFFNQFPVGEKYVLDFAFVNEQVSIELDGKNHRDKKQKRKDRIRDSYLKRNDWLTIRVKEEDIDDTYRLSIFKNLVKEVVQDRRKDWEVGNIKELSETFNEKDYE